MSLRFTILGSGTTTTIGQLNGAGAFTKNNSATLATLAVGEGNFTGVIGQTALTATGTVGLTKFGPGTLSLGRSNTYSGATTVNAGVLRAGASSTVFGSNSAVTLANTSGVTLDLNGYNVAIGSLAGGGASGGNVTLGGGTLTTGANNTSTSYAGGISGAGGLNKAGSGTMTLSGGSTYGGTTTLGGGTLALSGGNNRLPAGTTLVFTAASTLDVGSTSQTLADLEGGNGVTGNLRGSGGTVTIAGGFTLGGTAASATQTVDARNLSNLVVNASGQTVNIGGQYTGGGNNAEHGVLYLSPNTTLTATTLRVGPVDLNAFSADQGASSGTLYLGQSNILNVGTLQTGGSGGGNGTVQFASGLTNPTVTIRGVTGGSSRATITNGRAYDVYSGSAATFNLDGGTTDAMVGTLIAFNGVGAAVSHSGAFTMGAGTLDATTIYVVYDAAGGDSRYQSGDLTGTLNLNSGGTTKVSTLHMAHNGGYGVPQATLNLNGGSTLQVATLSGMSGTAQGTRTFNWNEGTIRNYDASTNLTINNNFSAFNLVGASSTHAFLIDSGRTGTVNMAMGGTGGFTKQGAGALVLTAASSYSGPTVIEDGLVTVSGGNGIGDNSAVTLSSVNTGAGLRLNASETVYSLAGGSASAGGVNLQGNPLTAGLQAGNASTTYSGVISGTGSLVRRGAGTLTLTGANTFTGGMTIRDGGTVSVATLAAAGTAQPLGAGTAPVVFDGNNATLEITGVISTSNRGLQLGATGFTSVLKVDGTLNHSGAVTGGSSSSTFAKSGAGTYNFSGEGNWSGDLAVTQGTFHLTGGGSIQNAGHLTVTNGSAVRLQSTGMVRLAAVDVTDGAVELESGTLRTNSITVSGTSSFNWGAATLTVQNNAGGSSGTVDRTGAGGAPSGPVLQEGTVLTVNNPGGVFASQAGSVLDLGSLYLSGTLRYDQIKVTGTLNLAAEETLRVGINPYLLRPSSPSSLSTGDWGTFVLVHADVITGTFDHFEGVGSDSIGWTQLPTQFNTGLDPSSLALNQWVLEYRTGFGPLAGGDALLLHYKVAGSVPEPAAAGLAVAGALLARSLRRGRREG
ncbi:MAG: autotransporter-associated beta strand repeat-containing protein [Kiritimatiellia bacterium]